MIKNPCYNTTTKTDCPDRSLGCAARCPKWAEYVKQRDAMYQQRNREKEAERYFKDSKAASDEKYRKNARKIRRIKSVKR